MNILYISNGFSFTPTHASVVTTYEIVKRLSDKGHQLTVLVPNMGLKEANMQSEKPNNIEIHALTHFPFEVVQRNLVLNFLTNTLWYVFLSILALKKVKPKTFDIVISMYHPTHMATFCAYFLSHVLGLRLIIKEHDLIPWLTDPNRKRRVYKRLMTVLNILVVKRGDIILVQNNERKRLVERFYGVREEKLILFANGVDVNKFRPGNNGSSLRTTLELENDKILLYSGTITKIRGLNNVIQALPIVIKEHPRIKVLMVGDGSEKQNLIDLATRLKVRDFIRFVESVDHELVPKFVSVADIAIGSLKSSFENSISFPIKILEYMACGKPVLACYKGASSDLVINGYNGILVHEGDTPELALTILRLICDENLTKELGDNARKHVEKFHDWNALVTKLDGVIKEQAAFPHR